MQNTSDTSSEAENPFVPTIFIYSRHQAIEDGVLFDASTGDLAEVSRQHFPKIASVAMTAAVHEMIRKAVENKHWHNDYKGVWHDICWMSKLAMLGARGRDCCPFRMVITGVLDKEPLEDGSNDLDRHIVYLKVQIHGGDDGEPCLTYMLPHED